MKLGAGIDISGAAAHVVVASTDRKIKLASVYGVTRLDELAHGLAGCSIVAIDSPDRWSAGFLPEHADLSPKFTGARCAEFELARQYRYWVPWVTPVRSVGESDPRFGWIRAGIRLFTLLRDVGIAGIEVYPNAIFRHLNQGKVLPKKSTFPGVAARTELLRSAGLVEPHLDMWSHDALDAAGAALTAIEYLAGDATSVSCGHDGSAMWLPAAT